MKGNDKKEYFNKKFARKIIEKDFKVGEQESFLYKSNHSNIWSITIKREENKYFPFIFTVTGEKIGTNEIIDRRHIGIKEALLYIVNDFNENIAIKNKYNNIEEYLEENEEITQERNNPRQFDYMMLDRLRSDCDYFLGCGNGQVKDLYYKDIDRHIEEMKKIYDSFSENEKPEWITMEDIDNYKEKMGELIEEKNHEEEL